MGLLSSDRVLFLKMNGEAMTVGERDDESAGSNCERCGDFADPETLTAVLGREVCESCDQRFQRALETYKDQLWGKRDVAVWSLGGFGSFISGIYALSGVVGLFQILTVPGAPPMYYQMAMFGGLFAISFALTFSYFLLQRWARVGIFILPLFLPLVLGLSQPASFPWGQSLLNGSFCAMAVLPALILTVIYIHPRNELAFRIEIEDEELRRLYENSAGNRPAYQSLLTCALGYLIPPLLFVALGLAMAGLRKSAAEAWPPVGGRGRALTALVFSLLGLSFWTLIVLLGQLS